MSTFEALPMTPTPAWPDVPALTTEAPLLGGVGGPLNAQAQALAARTALLKQGFDAVLGDQGALAVGDAVMRVATLTDLRATPAPTKQTTVVLEGVNEQGDSLGGVFYWAEFSTATDDGGMTYVRPTAVPSNQAGRWKRVTQLGDYQASLALRADLESPLEGAEIVAFIQSGAGAVERSSMDKMRERVSVKDFGAGSGKTGAENLAAIQAALNAAKYVTFGSAADSYTITGKLLLSSGHELEFCGATIVQDATQTPMFDATGTDKVTIRGGRFVGKAETTFVNTASSQAICVTASNATDLVVTGNRFEGFYYSPLMINTGGNRIEFSGNNVRGPGAAVLGVDPNLRNCTGATITGSNIRVFGNEIYFTAQGLIIGQGSSNITVNGNNIHDMINEHGIYADTGLKALSITGNTIRSTGANGTGVKVQFYDAFGVMPENIVISGNSISLTGSDAILLNNAAGTTLYATGVSICGNSIYQPGQHGIDVRYVRGATVSGNSVEQVAQYGIYVSKSTVCDITGNSIRATGGHGIFDDGTSSDITYANNIINSPGTNPANDCGMLIQGVSEHVFVGNVVRGTPSKTLHSFFINDAPGGLSTTEVRGNSFTGSNGVACRFPAAAGQLRYFGENILRSAAGSDVGQNIPETLQRGSEEHIYYGTAAPTSGTWPQGAKVFARYPSAGGSIGWVCVVGGAPGTWRTFGPVAA